MPCLSNLSFKRVNLIYKTVFTMRLHFIMIVRFFRFYECDNLIAFYEVMNDFMTV